MLAKSVNHNAPILNECGVLEFFASKLAPTGRLVQRGEQLAAVRGHQRVIVAQQFEHLQQGLVR